MTVEVTTRKWGNSLGVVLPKDLVDQQNLHENDRVFINVFKVADMKKVFGFLPKSKRSTQELKDLAREGWE